jgi:hypothetical protein
VVAGVVAEAVVELLEAVQVEDEDRGRAPGDRLGEPLPQQRPVGQAGQRVVVGLVAQPVLQLLGVADVAGVEDQALDVRVVEQVRDGHLGGADAAVGVRERELEDRGGVRGADHLVDGGGDPRGGLPGDDPDQAVADQVRRRVSEDPLDRLALVADRRVGVEDRHRVGALLDEGAEALLAGVQIGGALGDPGLQAAGQAAVLRQQQDLAGHDEQDRQGAGPGAQHGGLAAVAEADDADEQAHHHDDVGQHDRYRPVAAFRVARFRLLAGRGGHHQQHEPHKPDKP